MMLDEVNAIKTRLWAGRWRGVAAAWGFCTESNKAMPSGGGRGVAGKEKKTGKVKKNEERKKDEN